MSLLTSVSPALFCSKKVFDVARVLAGLWVFLCHSFYSVHCWFGYFSVLIFFFISGYGMEVTRSRSRALIRLPRFLLVLIFFAIIYRLACGVWFYPTAWYILSYSFVMLVYRFFGSRLSLFSLAFVLSLMFFYFSGFEYSWYVCPVGFLLGVYVYRFHFFFSWSFSLVSFLLGFLVFPTGEILFTVFWGPLVLRLFLSLSAMPFLSSLSSLAPLVFPFFSLHCWFLALFDSTWTLGGSSSFFGCIFAFCLSLVGAFVLWLYVPLFSKKKFWIIQ